MRFRMLGPLRVHSGSDWVPVRAAQQRVLLAALLVDAGTVVSTQRLVYEIWGDRPTRTALKTVHAYVMRLRRMLGEESASLLVTREHGYELTIADGDLDTWEFERLAGAGQAALAGGRPECAAAQLSEALALWRGPVLADVPDGPSRAAFAEQLEQTRLATLETYLTALLDLERHAEAAMQLHRLVEKHPLRERLWTLLMQAQRAAGQRADALATYQRARRVLQEELGLAPGEELRQLQRDILTEDQSTTRVAPTPPPRTVAPAQLPADVNGFTGREDQLKLLDSLLPRPGDPTATAVVISAITGTAGVGKTALAVHWAHQVKDRFPDGQLYVDLCGYADRPPVRPIEALARFLRALDVPPQQVPSDVDEASAMFRSRLASKRVLVLLDNGHHHEQIRPLLPGGGGCLVLITSRDWLTSLAAREGATVLSLDPLDLAEARLLLARLVGTEPIEAELEAATELARLCDCLPLALRIVAAKLFARPHTTIASYVARLRHDRFAALQLDGDRGEGVRAAFGLSYASLSCDARRLFRLLGLHPGPDLALPAAAALAGVDESTADRLLSRLTRSHLVEEHAAGRYALHDLLRHYAAELAIEEDAGPNRRAAMNRLCAYYLANLDSAATLLYPHVQRVPPSESGRQTRSEGFDDHGQALRWLDSERSNLAAVIARGAEQGLYDAAWRLADAFRGYLFMGMYTAEWRVVAAAGLSAATACGDLSARATAHLSLGSLEYYLDRYESAADHYRLAAESARSGGWKAGESAGLANLGIVFRHQGQLRKAAQHFSLAMVIDQQAGRREAQASDLMNLAQVQLGLGELEDAVDLFTQVLAIDSETGNRGRVARCLANLGETYHAQGRLDEALDVLTDSLQQQQAIGDRGYAVFTMWVLATVHRDAGRLSLAIDTANAAATQARELGDRWYQAETHAVIGSILLHCGQSTNAAESFQSALQLARDIGGSELESKALAGLALACQHLDADRAADSANQALAIARAGEYPLLMCDALGALAVVNLHRRRYDAATTFAEQASTIARGSGYRIGEARAQLVTATGRRCLGEPDVARVHRQRATALLAETGAHGGLPWERLARTDNCTDTHTGRSCGAGRGPRPAEHP